MTRQPLKLTSCLFICLWVGTNDIFRVAHSEHIKQYKTISNEHTCNRTPNCAAQLSCLTQCSLGRGPILLTLEPSAAVHLVKWAHAIQQGAPKWSAHLWNTNNQQRVFICLLTWKHSHLNFGGHPYAKTMGPHWSGCPPPPSHWTSPLQPLGGLFVVMLGSGVQLKFLARSNHHEYTMIIHDWPTE